MTTMLETTVANGILATVLALIVFGVTRFVKNPSVVYWLWMLVLLKLVTPPVLHVPLKLDIRKPNDDAVSVTPKEEEPHSTQQVVLLTAEESESVTEVPPVGDRDEPAAIPAPSLDNPEEEFFAEEFPVALSAIPGENRAGTLGETPRRWSCSLILG